MRILKWVVTVILVLGLLEGALLAAVVIDPDIQRRVRNIGTDVGDAWFGNAEHDGILAAYGEVANNVLVDAVLPLWSAPKPDAQDAAFSGCLDCHNGYWEQPRFDALYFDHPTHQESEIECAVCHTDTTHPAPPSPTMETCGTCHAEVGSPGECQLCHAPGDLAHYELMGVPIDGFRGCQACHRPGGLAVSDGDHPIQHELFNGSDIDRCAACHEVDFCLSCHQADHEDGWIFSHGQATYDDGIGTCLACHTTIGCGSCHEGATRLPLPTASPSGR